jgi:hypothetical protein
MLHSAHLIEYLEAITHNNGNKTQSNKVQTIIAIKPPKGSDNKTLHNLAKTTVTNGQDRMIACLSHFNGGVWSHQSNHCKGTKEVF